MVKQKLATIVGNVSNGKKQSKASLLKLQHLQNLAVWSGGDAVGLPSMGVFFGRQFAACGEALEVSPDDSLFICERCETILHPGDNCTVRIEKNKARKCHKLKGSKVPTQNNVVYTCHFCCHQTVKRGTLKGHMKRIFPPKVKPALQSKVQILNPENCADNEISSKESPSTPKSLEEILKPENCANTGISSKESSSTPKALEEILKPENCANTGISSKVNSSTPKAVDDLLTEPCRRDSADVTVDAALVENNESESIPNTPCPVSARVEGGRSLLDTTKRKRNKPGSKKEADVNSAKTDITGDVNVSKKRKKKTWTSLKDMVKSSGGPRSKNFTDITIPFFL